ncbi:CACNA1G [Symbiodinium natans]|uniref:CACNA1G protein n=1 Tax=Symbiodinium natans TaxID=878477 RepID=A0A812PUP5_9DINO|nr:CACNA1G [Symbiodinium natans]
MASDSVEETAKGTPGHSAEEPSSQTPAKDVSDDHARQTQTLGEELAAALRLSQDVVPEHSSWASVPATALPVVAAPPPARDGENDKDQELLQGLLSLRAAIVAQHGELLCSLDLHLQKLKAGSNATIESPAPFRSDSGAKVVARVETSSRLRRKAPHAAPARKSFTAGGITMPEDETPSRPSSMKSDEELVTVKISAPTGVRNQVFAAEAPLPGQLAELADVKSDEEDRSNFVAVVPQRAERRARRAQTAKQHLPTLSAKRRTSWLTRSQKVTSELHKDQDGQKPVKLSRNEKAEARKAGELAHGAGGLLSSFHAEYSTTAVMQSAVNGLASEQQRRRANNRCTAIVRNPWFERITLAMVILNAVEMALDVELNPNSIVFDSDSSPLFVVSHNLFCSFFLFELVIRCFAHGGLQYACRDVWFSFESLLGILMILETWVMPALHALRLITSPTAANTANSLRVARVLRVLRTARLARLVKLMPELMILVKGMAVACRSVFFTLLLLLIITVIFSINFIEFSRGSALEAVFFDSLWSSMGTLILHCILPDQEVFFRSVAAESDGLAVLVMLFILLGSFTVMNMLLGVLVEAVKTVTLIERENLDAEVARKVLWGMLEKDGSEDDERLITREEFQDLLGHKKAAKALASIGVDVMAAADIGKMLFEDDEAILFLDFMSAMLTLRGSNKTTVKDIVELRKYVAEEFLKVHSLVGELCGFLAEHLEPVGPLQDEDKFRRDASPTDLD